MATPSKPQTGILNPKATIIRHDMTCVINSGHGIRDVSTANVFFIKLNDNSGSGHMHRRTDSRTLETVVPRTLTLENYI